MSYPNIDVPNVAITSIDASLERGGWEAHFTAMNESDVMDPYQFVQIWWQGLFGLDDSGGLLGFQGHVLPLQISFDHQGSMTTFIATTTDGILKNGWLQGISFWDTDTDPRDHYHQFDSVTGGAAFERMTMGRIVRHLLGYYDQLGAPPATNPDWVAHSNLVYHPTQNPQGWITLDYVTDDPFDAILNPEGSMRVDRYNVRETNNLWETIKQIAKNEFFLAYFDKDNNFHYQRHPMYASALPTVVMTFDSSFSVGKPIVHVRRSTDISDVGAVRQVRLHAVQDDGSTIHAEYPASAVYVYGKTDEVTYIRCNDQDTLDEWARVSYLFQNRDVTVIWNAPGLCGLLFEIGDRVEITYTGTTENGVHIDWTAKKFWIHEIKIAPGVGFSGKTRFKLEAENV